MERRLTTIVAADIAGFSRLVGLDEEGTLAAQRSHRAELVDPLIEQHGGRIANTAGDSLLIEFPSAVQAVRCAVAVQEGIASRNADVPEDRRIHYRVGINIGDVVTEGEDLLGDGVNIAARLEGAVEPGGICVSDAVVAQTRGKVPIGFEDLGEQSLKNIETPVRVWHLTERGETVAPRRRRASPTLWYGVAATLLLVVAGGWWFAKEALAPSASATIDVDQVLTIKGPAIAALPFENLSGDADHDLFARGMTEQLAAALTRFKGVRVLSRRASAQYADDLSALQQELGADYLLEGSVRRDSERIRVTAILTKVESGAQIWTETFEAELSPVNLVEVQDDLAGKLAGAIAGDYRGAIHLDRVADRRTRPSDDQGAFDCVLAGWLGRLVPNSPLSGDLGPETVETQRAQFIGRFRVV